MSSAWNALNDVWGAAKGGAVLIVASIVFYTLQEWAKAEMTAYKRRNKR